MRIALRIVGTWLIGLSLVLLVIDGAKSLAANGLRLTTLGSSWTQINEQSIDAVRQFLDTRYFAGLLQGGFDSLLTYPAFAVVGIPGVILALAGRRRRRERFLRTEDV
jgi:hypothetical protein